MKGKSYHRLENLQNQSDRVFLSQSPNPALKKELHLEASGTYKEQW